MRVVEDADPYTKKQSSGTGGATPPLPSILPLGKSLNSEFSLILRFRG